MLPESDQAAQQIRTAQKRTIQGRRSAQSDVIAASRSGMQAIEHKFFCAESTPTRMIVQCKSNILELLPRIRGMHVYLNHAWIWSHREFFQAVINRWTVSFQPDRQAELASNLFDACQQIKVMFEIIQRRQKNMYHSVAQFDTQRGIDHFRWLQAGNFLVILPHIR